MRCFTDQQGHEWEAATAFGSYGTTRLFFSRRGATELRARDMAADTLREAEAQLAGCTTEVLRAWLADATPWQ